MSWATRRSRRIRSCGGVARQRGNASLRGAHRLLDVLARSPARTSRATSRDRSGCACPCSAPVSTSLPAMCSACLRPRPRAHLAQRRFETRVHFGRRIEHRRIGELVRHVRIVLRPAARRAASTHRRAPFRAMTSGGASRIRLPRMANDTLRCNASRTRCFKRGRRIRPRRRRIRACHGRARARPRRTGRRRRARRR